MDQERYILLGRITGRTGEREITFQPMAVNAQETNEWMGTQIQVNLNNPECIAWDQQLSHTIYTLEIGALPVKEMDAVFGTLARGFLDTMKSLAQDFNAALKYSLSSGLVCAFCSTARVTFLLADKSSREVTAVEFEQHGGVFSLRLPESRFLLENRLPISFSSGEVAHRKLDGGGICIAFKPRHNHDFVMWIRPVPTELVTKRELVEPKHNETFFL